MTPELLSIACLIGIIVSGGLGLKWLCDDLRGDAEVRANIHRRLMR